MICTGRSDFPNQVNNVLCFPYIFRGALDAGATTINEEMKTAAVRAIAQLAREEPSDVAARAYSGDTPVFGPDYLIPSPFDPRLILRIAPAVAKAAADSGVALRPIDDEDAYIDRLNRFVFRSGLVMKPIFAAAQNAASKRVVYADGEDERVLRAAQVVLEDRIARPILIGRPEVIESRLQRFGLKIRPGEDFDLINPENDPRYRDYVDLCVKLVGRRGVTPDAAKMLVRTNTTVIAALALQRGEADAMICGLEGRYERHLRHVRLMVGMEEGTQDLSALSMLISQRGVTFFTDTYVTVDPSADEIAEMTLLAAREIARFGIEPKAALLSHSNFGSRDSESAMKMRKATTILHKIAPDLCVDGEMHSDSALDARLRERVYPNSVLNGEANLLVFPNLDSANITLNAVKSMTEALHVGPILVGTAKPAHILTPSVTSRGVVNMTALAVVEAAQKGRYGHRRRIAGINVKLRKARKILPIGRALTNFPVKLSLKGLPLGSMKRAGHKPSSPRQERRHALARHDRRMRDVPSRPDRHAGFGRYLFRFTPPAGGCPRRCRRFDVANPALRRRRPSAGRGNRKDNFHSGVARLLS